MNPHMFADFETERHKFSFDLIPIAQASYKMFLKSDNPKVKMLGILGNFGEEDSYIVIKQIVSEVQSFTKGDFAESRYFKQLRIFVQLRSSVEQQFEKAMETITKFFKEEKDFLFRKGEKKERIAIAREMKKDGISIDQIAKFTKLSVEEIEAL